MNKNEIKELDLVLTRDKSLYMILYHDFYKGLGLYDTDFNFVTMLSSYDEKLLINNGKRNMDIVGLIRGESKWYQLSRFKEYEDSSRRGEDLLRYSKQWKWLWKLENINVVNMGEFEDLMYYSSDLSSKDAEQYYHLGKDIKKICIKLYNSNYRIYRQVDQYEFIGFIEKYINSEFAISDTANYIIYRNNKGNIVCKKQEEKA